jgi:hypothetical protein
VVHEQRPAVMALWAPRHERIEDRATTPTERVADCARDLDVRILEDLLDPVLVLDALPRELLTAFA